MVSLGYIKNLVEKLFLLQDKFKPELDEYTQEEKGRVALLRVVGLSGETLLLKEQNGRLQYAESGDQPVHVFRCSEDTFLDLLAGDTTIRKEATLGHFTIEDAESGDINLVELERWAKAFERMKGLLKVIA